MVSVAHINLSASLQRQAGCNALSKHFRHLPEPAGVLSGNMICGRQAQRQAWPTSITYCRQYALSCSYQHTGQSGLINTLWQTARQRPIYLNSAIREPLQLHANDTVTHASSTYTSLARKIQLTIDSKLAQPQELSAHENGLSRCTGQCLSRNQHAMKVFTHSEARPVATWLRIAMPAATVPATGK